MTGIRGSFTGLLVAALVAASAPSAVPQQAARRGGSVTLALYQEPEMLNPLLTIQVAAEEVEGFVFDGLVTENPKGQYIPRLAAELPTAANGGISPDAKTITYKLRPGLTWSDGQPLTCDDVKFTWEARVTPKSGAVSTSGYTDIQSVDCPDPRTVVVRYKTFYAPFLSKFGDIIPRHGTGDPAAMTKWDFNRKPVGSGPYKMAEWVSGDHITLVRNDRYWVKDKPYLDRVIVRIVPSREVAKQLIRTGDVDIVWNLAESDVAELKSAAGVRVSSAPGPFIERLVLNLADPALDGPPIDVVKQHPHPILGDPRVREAIELGINKREITSKLLYGLATVGTNEQNMGWAACVTPPSTYNPPRARRLLEEAGWAPGADGIRVSKGTRLRLKLQTTTGDKLREQTEQLLIEYMRSIGVDFYIENVPSPVLFGSWASGAFRKHGHFDIVMYSTGSDVDPQSHLENFFSSWNIPTAQNAGAGFNFPRYASPVVDAALKRAGSVADQAVRRQAYCTAMGQILRDRPHIYLYDRATIHAYRDRLQGWIANVWIDIGWNAEDWSVNR